MRLHNNGNILFDIRHFSLADSGDRTPHFNGLAFQDLDHVHYFMMIC